MKLYNTPEHQAVELQLDANRPATIYTCGPTVYDTPHIGNWYTFIRYDLLNRTLRATGHATHWVMNITDVGHLVSDGDDGEDKLEKGAKREGGTAWEIAARYGSYFVDGLQRLNFSTVDALPKATDYLPQQIALIEQLEKSGHTYVISDGVYFDTSTFPAYAEFAHLQLAEQAEGARVESNPEKRNPSDFALWKFSPVDAKRDMEWDSPWGKGFPGWHLECSAMIHDILGQPIDIHGGGVDHIPVHHTNEIAQSVAAYGTPLSHYWMHCNHIQVNGQKMSKSLNNFLTLEDIEAKGFPLVVFRLHVLSGHYRSQSEFSWEGLQATRNRLQNWVDTLNERLQGSDGQALDAMIGNAVAALEDDLNSPAALASVDEILPMLSPEAARQATKRLDELFGIDLAPYLAPLDEEASRLIEERNEARSRKDWPASDALRTKLLELGITVRDGGDSTVWSRTV